jgi:hypothetical protein
MVEHRRGPELTPQERRELDENLENRRGTQPYATELDNRELETAHKDKRPVKSDDEKAKSVER